jgi:hypothetical protein
MAITRPTSKSIISTTQWGIPITDAVNANTTDIAALKPTAWTAITLSNGWTNYGGAYPTAAVIRQGNFCTMRGMLSPGTLTLGTVVGTIPVGFRPPGTVEAIVYTYAARVWFAQIAIRSDGTFTLNTDPASTLGSTALAGPMWSI